MRALFFGSPAFAVPCLDALTSVAEVAAVFCQPDKPAGRGLTLTPPDVKVRALELGLRVEQPAKVRTEETAALVRSFDADVAVVVAYGRILPKALLAAPRAGCLNVHASILPRWRGAAPIQWAVASGDPITGVTLMQMDEGLDTGPILEIRETPIGETETAGELFQRLAPFGATMIRERLADVVEGRLVARPQPSEGLTHARLLEKSDGVLDFVQEARLVDAWARGMTPWPGAQTRLGDDWLKVHGTSVVESEGQHGEPGTIVGITSESIQVACGHGIVGLRELQQAGRKRLGAQAFAAGARLTIGTRLGGRT